MARGVGLPGVGGRLHAPPALPQAIALYAHLRSAPVRDFWVRPGGVLWEGVRSGWALPLEMGGGHPWAFASPCETLWRAQGLGRRGMAGGGGGGGNGRLSVSAGRLGRGFSVGVGAVGEEDLCGEVSCALEARTRALTLPLRKLAPPLTHALGAHFGTFLPLERIALQRRALALGSAAQAVGDEGRLRTSAAALVSPYLALGAGGGCGVAPLSPHALWQALSLSALNGYLAGRLSPEEAAFNRSAPTSRDPTTLAGFPIEFPPAPLGSPPAVYLLHLRNTSHLPLHLTIALPTEPPVPAEPWALEMDEPSADELADHELCDRAVFGVYPRALHIPPGGAAPLRLHYAYATLLNDGRHEITVLLRIAGGKPVRLLFRGQTLPLGRAYLYTGLPGRAVELPPIPLALAAPPRHTIPLRNPSTIPLRYALLPHTLAALRTSNYGHAVLACPNPRGVLLPGQEGALHIVFSPLETKRYECQLVVVWGACAWGDSAAAPTPHTSYGNGSGSGEGSSSGSGSGSTLPTSPQALEEEVRAEEEAAYAWLGGEVMAAIQAAEAAKAAEEKEEEEEEEEEGGGGQGGRGSMGEERKESKGGEEGEEEGSSAFSGGLGALGVERSVRTARRLAQAPLGKHQAADTAGYESQVPGVLRIAVTALGYQPGGISMGGKAAMPLVPAPPPAALGIALPTPPQPSTLDALHHSPPHTHCSSSSSALPPSSCGQAPCPRPCPPSPPATVTPPAAFSMQATTLPPAVMQRGWLRGMARSTCSAPVAPCHALAP